MDRRTLLDCLHRADFTQLFIECGWSNPTTTAPYLLSMDGTTFAFSEAAQLRGYRIFVCTVPELPDLSTCRWLDSRLRKRSHDYLAIYLAPPASGEPMHHLWAVPVTSADKRQLVKIEYRSDDQAAFLSEKLDAIAFSFDETPSILDVAARVDAAFLVNASEVTKRFYREFRTQHDRFVEGIKGLSDPADRDWYTSVMLNRLMFCYFIQKRGFLDSDPDYLANKLAWVRRTRGANHFQSFYRSFLLRLFREGLDTPATARPSTWNPADFGRIPYLNGGMFAEHPLEKDNPSLDIPDETFERLFDFFDQWRWHLDTRLSSTGRDINPDVLGYIFEQYINDRAQMGAYYTKEDITEYISRSTILPWLLSETARKGHDDLFSALPASGDRYIFPALLKGADLPLPPEIAAGIPPEPAVTLRERRALWNRPADPAFALPTEIWRETIARRTRLDQIRRKIKTGAVRTPDDFVTLNLDIRAFAEDLLRDTHDHLLVRHFHDALRRVTILDPTCGSGAFLFAALDILEPLYDACLDRMEEFHAANPRLFKPELDELASARNRQYHIYKSIILRNLHGVDLMHEATEIARLRLFLKLVSAVDPDTRDPNLGLDPLPDIDFNIRTGNTLVGYTSAEDINFGLAQGDMFTFAELKQTIDGELLKISTANRLFRESQLIPSTTAAELAEQKHELQNRLVAIETLLNDQLAPRNPQKKAKWLESVCPFHWYAAFHSIMSERGGFDIIIGNPPYVEYSKVKNYTISGYKTESCGNLYAFVLERIADLANEKTQIGFIVPISSVSNQKFLPLSRFLVERFEQWVSCYSNRPGKLFEGVEQRLTITIGKRCENPTHQYWSSEYQHWYIEERPHLFQRLTYYPHVYEDAPLYKVGQALSQSILEKIETQKGTLVGHLLNAHAPSTYYHNAPTYFIRAMGFKPNSGRGMRESSHYKTIMGGSDHMALLTCLLNSSLFYWFYKVISNCRDFSEREIAPFPIGAIDSVDFSAIEKKLRKSYIANREIKSRIYPSGEVYYEEYYPSLSKPILDEIDTLLAQHYGFTEEELDYIINYDIKYRMGDRLDSSGE